MEGRERPHVVKYKAVMNDWNYDASCTLTSLPVWDLENFNHLVFVVQSVHIFKENSWCLDGIYMSNLLIVYFVFDYEKLPH
jgi:hypothetical protein